MALPLILVVDDAPDIVMFIEAVLEDSYRTITASNGKNAIKIALSKHPDLILLDVQMPEMDGHQTCKTLKNNPETHSIPIIMVSGMREEGDELIGLQAGAVDYITKPISVAILQARINNQLLLLQTRRELENAHLKISMERKYIEDIIDKMRNAYSFNNKHIQYASRSPEINSGDLVLSVILPDGYQVAMVADFTGHGLPSAIGIPLVSYIFHKSIIENIHPMDMIFEINKTLTESLPINLFMAAALIEVNPSRTQAKLWNFGMEDILLLNPDHSWHSFQSKNCALGIIKDIDTTSHYDLQLKSKQHIYLLTDGVTEASDQELEDAQEMFGIGRLKSLLQQDNQSLDIILDQILAHASSPQDFDDMTILELSI